MSTGHVRLGRPEAPPSSDALAATSTTREFDRFIRELLGPEFLISIVLAGIAAIALVAWDSVHGTAVSLIVPALGMGAAAALAASHRWISRSHPSRDEGFSLRRHRAVVLLLGTGCAWASASAWALPSDTLATLTLAFLIVQAGLGGVASAADRPSLVTWLICVVALPLLALSQGTDEVREKVMIPLLAAQGLIVLGLSFRIRHMLARALRVRRENDRLVTQLRQQVALVETANAEKSRFLGAASHDLRQPMHALGLFAAALEKEVRGTPHHPKVISMARAVDALEDSFGAMLDVSRLDAGIVQPTLQSFPIRDVFRRLYMHCAGQAEERGLSLRFKAGGKLVTSDPQLLERILSNLVHNAIRYTESGGIVLVTRTRAERTCVEVWDTGVGIPPDELPKIFNEFYQVGNPGRDRTRGLGMGLAIVKRLVVLLGHELEVSSTPGRGTVFRVLMPQTELADMQSMVLGADTIPSAPDEDRTVLVIDDEAPVRAGMQELLEGWGFMVLVAGTIGEASAAVRRHAGVIDMVVSDLRLGGDEDGIDAIAQVRQQYGAPLPALLITGDTSATEVKRAHDSGHPVMFKPVRARDLFAALRRAP